MFVLRTSNFRGANNNNNNNNNNDNDFITAFPTYRRLFICNNKLTTKKKTVHIYNFYIQLKAPRI